ncbi:RNA-binding protein 3-like [Sciurus carolinensis]|uniref:RNA-binding protein 3-like n=1 Tax=Sciurus carolinensis TaxID=30640 RepID=UPI001FB54C10|nr:RNA-binding protein 3-like [Sciurus carolinensis]
MSSEEEKFLVEGLNFNTSAALGLFLRWSLSRIGRLSNPRVFINLTNPEHASDATKAKNGECLDGHQIHVEHAGKSDQAPEGMSLGPMDVVTGRVGGNQGYGRGQYDS